MVEYKCEKNYPLSQVFLELGFTLLAASHGMGIYIYFTSFFTSIYLK